MSATASIERALGSADAEDRRQATAELGRAPIGDVLAFLLASLGDPDWRVRKEATLVARSFGGEPPLLAALVEVFAGGDNVGLRNAAVEVLASAGPAATAALAGALPRLDADGRKLAVETLGRGGDPAALDALEAALGDSDDNVRQGAAEAIAAVGPRAPARVAALLLARLDDRDGLVRLTALSGLTRLQVAIPWARLSPLLDAPTLRAAALSAAALSESPEAARALASALAGARGSAFDQALRALGRLSEGPLGSSVTAALRDVGPELGARLVTAALPDGGGDDVISRRGVALHLAAMAGASGVIDAAVAALAEDLLAEPARLALVGLGAPALPAMFARLADASDARIPPEARAALVDVIADVLDVDPEGGSARRAPPDGLLAALRGAARDPERHVAMRALRALSRLGNEGDLTLAAEQALDPERPVAVAAEGALAALAIRFPQAARAFVDRVARDEVYLLPAAIVIGALGAAPSGLPFAERDAVFLAHAATAGDTGARRAAIEAVSSLRAAVGAAYPAALEVLSFALTDEEHEVQTAAARALGRLCSAPDAPRAAEVLDLVDRAGVPDLLAATVRAMGDGMPLGPSSSAPAGELISALALLARGAPHTVAAVAVAAVDSLGRAHRAGAASAIEALAGAVDHPDEDVVKAALLKLADCTDPEPPSAVVAAVARGLGHASASVRALAVEILAEREGEDVRAALVARLAVEPDRRVEDVLRSALAGLGVAAPVGSPPGAVPNPAGGA